MKAGWWNDCEVVGTGTYSRVVRMSDTRVGKIVGIKPADAPAMAPGKTLQRCLREAHLHSVVSERSPRYVTRVEHVLLDEHTMVIVQEYMDGRNLDQNAPLPLPHAQQVLRKTLHGLAACHDAGICYGDLKAENIMLDSRGHSKLIDFGCAEVCHGRLEGCAPEIKGTIPYMAPEIIRRLEHGHAVDVWAFGVLAARLLSPDGEHPFGRITLQTWTPAFARQYDDPLLHPSIPVRMREALRSALEVQPANRPSAADLLGVFVDEGDEVAMA